MWFTVLFSLILNFVVFPRYLFSFIWLIAGIYLFTYSTLQVNLDKRLNGLLTQTVCTVESVQSLEKDCTQAKLNYTIGPRNYSNLAKSAYYEKCLDSKILVTPNKNYNCWYKAESRNQVYLDTRNENNFQRFRPLGILLIVLSCCRILYLFFTRRNEIPPITTSPETSLSIISNAIISIISVTLIPVLITAMLGFVIVTAIMLVTVSNYYYHRTYTATPCQIIEKKFEDVIAVVHVNYNVGSLNYDAWTRDLNASKFRNGYAINSTQTCYYDAKHPFNVSLYPAAEELRDVSRASFWMLIVVLISGVTSGIWLFALSKIKQGIASGKITFKWDK